MFTKTGEKETTYLEGGSIPSIRYHIFEKLGFVRDGFSTRRGGVSRGQFASMNFSVKMGDDPELVRENFRIFTERHRFSDPVMTDQTHSTNVKRVFRKDAGKNVFVPRDYSEIDGFVTNETGLTLVTTFADCVPLYFVDVKNHAIGLSHSGWRGTKNRIGRETIEMMHREFGTRPEDIRAAIGPSICVNCYEVSRELAEEFKDEFQTDIAACEGEKFPEWDMNHIVYKRRNQYYLNLWAANFSVLFEAGVRKENIALPDICTCCNGKELFSHRASKGKRGNLCAFLMIEE